MIIVISIIPVTAIAMFLAIPTTIKRVRANSQNQTTGFILTACFAGVSILALTVAFLASLLS